MARLLCALFLVVPAAASAQVVERSPGAFMLKTELTVAAPPLSVYNLFVN